MIYKQAEHFTIYHGSCLDVMRELPDNSVDSIVTDPPYELGFMGKSWDASGIAYNVEVWRQALRVLKPGGHLLAFSGSRTYHRMTVAIEDAGFEIRDQIMWIYGSGFPKSHDVSKAIDKAAGAEREVVGQTTKARSTAGDSALPTLGGDTIYKTWDETAPATAEAQQWAGWGTALKPAHEPIVVARKQLIGTVAANVLAYGTGGLNIDGCRIGSEQMPRTTSNGVKVSENRSMSGAKFEREVIGTATGRWPANVLFDEEAAAVLDGQSGVSKSPAGMITQGGDHFSVGSDKQTRGTKFQAHGDTGGASRFFYVAKASKKDRNEGLNLCACDKLTAWELEGQEAQRQAVTDQLVPRDTDEFGTQNSDGSEWNTLLSGNESAEQSPTAGKSTTLTETNSTTTFQTSLPLMQSPTSDFTQAANFATGNGGNLAKSAKSSNLLEPPIGISAKKAGRNMDDANLATLELLSNQNNSGVRQCANCGGIKGGHPTVKPTQLMQYLVRLVTPPNGVVLDPFLGSGSTGKAAMREGFDFIGIELTDDYLPLAVARIESAERPLL